MTRDAIELAFGLIAKAAGSLAVALARGRVTRATIGECVNWLEQALVFLRPMRESD